MVSSAFHSNINNLRKASNNNTITPPQHALQIWDGGASHHLIAPHSLDLVYNLKPLQKHISIDGITGNDGRLTHSCKILGLPETCNDAYFGQGLSATLLSLGLIQRNSGSYRTVDNSTVEIVLPSRHIPPITVKLSDNNLLHVDTDQLISLHLWDAQRTDRYNLRGNAAQRYKRLQRLQLRSRPCRVPSALHATMMIEANDMQYNKCLHSLRPRRPCLVPSALHATVEISAMQRKRAGEANQLHLELDCIPDDALIKNIATGKIVTHLTSKDILLNRDIRGPCPHCLEARAKAPPAPSSTSEPATRPGERLSFDIQQLYAPAAGGFTHKNTIVDQKTGFASVEGMINKTTQNAFNSIKAVTLRDYNQHGHRVDSAHGDAEQVNVAIAPQLNAIGIKSIISMPQHFARQVERYREHIQNKTRAIHARLRYILPATYDLLAEQSAVYNINRTLNSHSDMLGSPLTPEEAVTGKRSKPPVPFGTVTMVRIPIDKSNRVAQLHNQDPKIQARAEIGVSMGFDPKTGGTRYLLENGLVLPRIAISTFPSNVIPFGYKPKPHQLLVVETAAEQPSPPTAATPSPPEPTTNATTTLNRAIQLPNAPNQNEALATLTSQKQQADTALLNEIRFVQPNIPSTPTLLGTTNIPTSHPLLLAPPTTPIAPTAIATTLQQPPFTPTAITTTSQQQQQPHPALQETHTTQQQQQSSTSTIDTTLARLPQSLWQQTALDNLHTPSTPSRSKNPATLQPLAPPHTPTIMPPPQSLSPVTEPRMTAALPLLAAPTTPQLLRRSTRGTAHPDGYWKGYVASQPTPDYQPPSNHLQRKGILNMEARAEHSNFRRSNPILDQFTNKSTDIRPTPSSLQSRVFTLRSAIRNLKPAPLMKGMSEEMEKTFEKFKCFKLLNKPADKNAEFIRLLFAIKEKPLLTDPDNIRVRVAADGSGSTVSAHL